MFHFVFSDLRRNWPGVTILVLLVALATALGVGVTLQERALRLGSARAAAPFDLVIGAPGSETQLMLSAIFLQPAPLSLLPGSVLADLRNDPRVEAAVPVGFGDFFETYPIVGVTQDIISIFGGLSEGDGFETLEDAVAGALVGRPVGFSFHPFHGSPGEAGEVHADQRYHIKGRMNATGTPWDRAIFVPIQSVWEAHHHHDEAEEGVLAEGGHGAHDEEEHEHHEHHENAGIDESELNSPDNPGVPAIIVKPHSIADAYNLRQEYRSDTTMAAFPGEVLTRLFSTLGDARRVLSVVAGGAQVLVAASLLLVIAVQVMQRRRQIGALRAFGASRFSVLSIVWLEVFSVLAVGLVLGFGLGYIGVQILSAKLSDASGILLPIQFETADGFTLLSFLVAAALITILPGLIAYRQSPAQALRQ